MQRLVKIAPSILASDFACLGDEIRAIDAAGADYIHIDVMDGHFVPNLTVGPPIIKALRSVTEKPFDVHLMIAPVDAYISDFAAAGADILTVHPEAGPHLHRTLQMIKGVGKRAGVALNPATPIAAVETVMDLVDLILVMTVNPGFGGQAFLTSQLGKIAKLRRMIQDSGREIDLEVDGGIKADNADLVIDAGANTLVAGTAIFGQGADQYASAIDAIRSARAPVRHGELIA